MRVRHRPPHNLKLFLCVRDHGGAERHHRRVAVRPSARLEDKYRTCSFIPYVAVRFRVGVVFGYIFEYRGVLNTAIRGLGLISSPGIG